MDAAVIKKTQEILGKVIKKPPLTEKLLSKPPFRFLHDILTEVIKATGVLKGLFKPEEMNSENVKDKEAKMFFLQKAIDCVGIMTGEALSARPSKIVAGHEPEKTNEFLQSLGKACIKKIDSSEAVKKTLSGEKPSSGKSRKKDTSRTSSKERPKESGEKPKEKDSKKDEKDSRKKDDKKERGGSSSKDRDREKDAPRKGREEKEKNGEREKERGRDRERSKESDRKKEQEKEKVKDINNEPGDDTKPSTNADPATHDLENEDDNNTNRGIQRPSSAKGQRRRPTNSETDKESKDPANDVIMDSAPAPKQAESVADEGNQQEDDVIQRQPSSVRRPARPSSARPAPPKIKRNEEVEDPGIRLGSGKQVNAVIVDNGKEQDDEDDLFVVEDNAPHESFLDENVNEGPADADDGQHGSLVKKMLDSRREAEIAQAKSLQNKEKPIIIDATRKKEKEMAQKEIEKLRNSIQTLCRSAHPLGKIMDYLQEDMDSMQKELEHWKEENKKYHLALKAEQSITESDIEPLHAQLGELELEIADMVDRIGSVKSNILRNEDKIRDMINGISR